VDVPSFPTEEQPGMRPVAYMRSSTSIVQSVKKSQWSFAAVAVGRLRKQPCFRGLRDSLERNRGLLAADRSSNAVVRVPESPVGL